MSRAKVNEDEDEDEDEDAEQLNHSFTAGRASGQGERHERASNLSCIPYCTSPQYVRPVLGLSEKASDDTCVWPVNRLVHARPSLHPI